MLNIKPSLNLKRPFGLIPLEELIKNENQAKFEAGMIFTVDELYEMAEYLSYSKFDAIENKTWYKLAISLKRYQQMGYFEETKAIELLEKITNKQKDVVTFYDIMFLYSELDTTPNNNGHSVTIYTWLKYAMENGYKPTERINKLIKSMGYKKKFDNSHYSMQHEKYHKETTELKLYKPYLHINEIFDILDSFEGTKILVQSPTNSGKTSMVTEFATLDENKSNVYIIAQPTRMIASQLTKSHNENNVLYVAENMKKRDSNGLAISKKQAIKYSFDNGCRVFAATYDAVLDIIDVTSTKKDINIILVIDEAHHIVTDYGKDFRRKAINRLVRAINIAHTTIAFSATPEQLPSMLFDNFIKITRIQGDLKLFEKFQVLDVGKDVIDSLTLHIINRLKMNLKQIVYLDNKTEIQKLKNDLIANGLVVQIITADKKDDSYETIVEEKKLDENIDVLIVTSIMTEGISILNSRQNFEVTIVLKGKSSFYNPINVIQAANRLRNLYHGLTIVKVAKEVEAIPNQWSFLKRFNFLKSKAERYAYNLNKKLEEEFTNNISYLHTSIIEEIQGVYFDTQIKKYCVDYIYLAYSTVNALMSYNMKFTDYYVSILAQYFKKEIVVINIDVLEDVNLVNEQSTLSKYDINEAQSSIPIHKKINRVDFRNLMNPEVQSKYKDIVPKAPLKALAALSTIIDYDIAMQSLEVDLKLAKEIDALTDLIFLTDKRFTLSSIKTLKVYAALKERIECSSEEVRIFQPQLNWILKEVAREHTKVTTDNVETVFKKFFRKSDSKNNYRFEGLKTTSYVVKALTFSYVASKYNIEKTEIIKAVQEQAQKNHPDKNVKQLDEIIMNAMNEYGVD